MLAILRHYPSEISALAHRLGAGDLRQQELISALTNASFYERADVAEESSGAQPSLEDIIGSSGTNEELASEGGF